jgi:3-dehydroquinate synthase class II
MATTTATITLASADLLSDNLSLSATQTLHKAGTTTGLDGIQYEKLEIAADVHYDIIDATAAGANKANKVYIANKHTDSTKYINIYIKDLVVGRLYAGDWMFIPLEAAAATQDVSVKAISAAQVIEFSLIHEGKTLVAYS